MARSTTYRLNDYSTLDVTEEDGDTEIAIAGISDVTITPNVSIEHLYTADSIKAADRMQHEFQVNVEIGYAFFDGEIVEYWLNGAGGASASSMSDTSDPQTFAVTGEFQSADGSNVLSCTVEDITFSEMPVLSASNGEFAQWDLTGTGEDLTEFSVEAPV